MCSNCQDFCGFPTTCFQFSIHNKKPYFPFRTAKPASPQMVSLTWNGSSGVFMKLILWLLELLQGSEVVKLAMCSYKKNLQGEMGGRRGDMCVCVEGEGWGRGRGDMCVCVWRGRGGGWGGGTCVCVWRGRGGGWGHRHGLEIVSCPFKTK